jgi:hypothetical protein
LAVTFTRHFKYKSTLKKQHLGNINNNNNKERDRDDDDDNKNEENHVEEERFVESQTSVIIQEKDFTLAEVMCIKEKESVDEEESHREDTTGKLF